MTSAGAKVGRYILPPLTFAYDALAPVIDEPTLRLHHDAHHRAYVDGVNAAFAPYPEWQGLTIEEVLRRSAALPDGIRETVRHQGGGHANHQFFWKILTPAGCGEPAGGLFGAIVRDFGSFARFKSAFETAGMRLFGSGWVFLVCRPHRDFRLEILTLPNEDSVLSLAEPAPGLLVCDLWEHAYDLTYHNRRADWLKAWWAIVDWDLVAERLQGVREGRLQL